MTVKTSPKCVKAKAPQKRTVEEIEDLKLDLTELKQGILPALSRICSNYEELLEENKILRQALMEADFEQEEIESLQSANMSLTAQYITAKSLINIPDNIAGLVEELIKTRLLVWDKCVMDVTANPEKFDAYPELNRAFSKKAGGNRKSERK